MDIYRARIWNTKREGTLEFFVYGQGNKFIGVCLTLDIVEEGDDPQNLMNSIVESAMGHVSVVQSQKLDDSLLNRPAPKEYWDRYFNVLKKMQENARPKGYIYTMPINPAVHA